MACDGGNADACAQVGRLLLKDVLRDIPKTALPANATDPATIAAETGLSKQAREALVKSTTYLSRGCAGGSSGSNGNCCYLLATIRMDRRISDARSTSGAAPLSPEQDPVSLLERACEAENVKACNTLSLMFRSGSTRFGVPQDSAQSAAFAKRGLMLGGMSETQAERNLKHIAEQVQSGAKGLR